MIAEVQAQLIHDLVTGSDGAGPPVGVPVHDFFPGRVVAPCLVVGMEPVSFIVGGQTFCEYELRFTVVALVAKSETYVADLEALIEKVLANTVDWGTTGVDGFSALVESGQELLGTTIHLNKLAKL